MKKRWFLLLLVIGGGFLACDNDLDLVADWKEIPVVYGFLSVSDTAQYIRVEKAFLDKTTSALIIARNPDSLYIEGIQVQIEDLVTGQFYDLQRVAGADEGYPRKDGTFAEHPNYLYKIKTENIVLVEDRAYRLWVKGEDGRIITTSQTTVVGAYEIQFSSPPLAIPFRYDNAVRISWSSSERAARFYDAKIVIHFDEYLVSNPSQPKPKFLEWELENGLLRGNNQSTTSIFVPGIEFFRFLESNLEAQSGISRKFKLIQIVVDAGGSEFYEFLSVGEANTGITGAEFVASYSNIDNGFGLFSSRSQVVATNYTLNPQAMDSLRNGIYTRELNFF